MTCGGRFCDTIPPIVDFDDLRFFHPATMTFQVRIQNLGKLADATVRVGDLTVLAGVNNTGKTFFSKSLYSVIGAVNANHLMVEFDSRAKPLRENLRHLTDDRMFAAASPPSVAELLESVDRMELAAKQCSAGVGGLAVDIDPEEECSIGFKQAANNMLDVYGQLKPALSRWGRPSEVHNEYSASKFYSEAERLRFLIDHNVNILYAMVAMTMGQIVASGFHHQAARSFLRNFQIQDIEDLGSRGSRSVIYIDGERILDSGEYGGIDGEDFPFQKLFQLHRRANSFFLESPALWRLKGILESVMLESLNGRVRSDVPEYFRELLAALVKSYSGEMPFPEVYRRLTEEVIGGRIVQNDLGELRFAESGGGNYALSMTATGVVNLGILALLLEKKLVDKGAFLFIDEPESNLHPEWQVAMTEALWELARGGVNVVIATHSVDILKRLEIYAEEKETKEDAKNLIAVNHFQRDGTVQSGGVEKIVDVQEDLSGPFFELYKRGL